MLSPLLWHVIPIEIFVSSSPRVYWFTILSSPVDESAVLILTALNTSYLKVEERHFDRLPDNAAGTASIHVLSQLKSMFGELLDGVRNDLCSWDTVGSNQSICET